MSQDILKKYKREEELPKEADEQALKRKFEELKKQVPETFPPDETEEKEK